MADPDLDPLLDAALDAAHAGGAAILPFYGRPIPVHRKADDSPLTQADLASHRAISDRLASTQLPVLSEESDPSEVSGRQSWLRYWCVDPLDGTKEFVRGAPGGADPPVTTGEFAVHVALVDDGRPTVGVVHLPVLDVTYWAAGGRAWRQTGGGAPVAISTRPSGDTLAVLVSRDHAGPETEAVLTALAASGRAVTTSAHGSSLKVCRIAEGQADLYPRLGPTWEWDTAAPQAIVEASGGGLTDAAGAPLTYNRADLRNPSFVCWGDPSNRLALQ